MTWRLGEGMNPPPKSGRLAQNGNAILDSRFRGNDKLREAPVSPYSLLLTPDSSLSRYFLTPALTSSSGSSLSS